MCPRPALPPRRPAGERPVAGHQGFVLSGLFRLGFLLGRGGLLAGRRGLGLRFGRVIRRIRRGGGARHGFHHVDAQIVVGDGGLEVIQGDAIAPGDFALPVRRSVTLYTALSGMIMSS